MRRSILLLLHADALKLEIVTDARGIPLGTTIAAANLAETDLIEDAIDGITVAVAGAADCGSRVRLGPAPGPLERTRNRPDLSASKEPDPSRPATTAGR
jgi:hypothetical protein